MPIDPQLRQGALTWAKFLETDPNRPYRVRRRKKTQKDSRGGNIGSTPEYEYRTMNNIRSQPLGDKEFDRLPEGLRGKSWRFLEVVPEKPGDLPSSPDEFLDMFEQLEYKGHWYEVRFINDWDLIQGCKAVFVE